MTAPKSALGSTAPCFDLPDGGLRDAEFGSDLALRTWICTDGGYLIGCKPTIRTDVSASLDSIKNVLALRADQKVIRIAALSVVASVTNYLSLLCSRYDAMYVVIRVNALAVLHAQVLPNLCVAGMVNRVLPFPALIRFADLYSLPNAVKKRLSSITGFGSRWTTIRMDAKALAFGTAYWCRSYGHSSSNTNQNGRA